MILVQHWSLVELRQLYDLADQEARNEQQSPLLDDPPPRYESYRALEQGPPVELAHEKNQQISLHVPTEHPSSEDSSQAIVKYQERPIQQLDASFNQALARENRAMNADVPDIVDHLLHEWTRIPEAQSHSSPPRNSPRDNRRKSYYESDTDDTSDSEFEGSLTGGRYLEGPPRNRHKGKVQFRARVESDPEDAVRVNLSSNPATVTQAPTPIVDHRLHVRDHFPAAAVTPAPITVTHTTASVGRT